MKRSTARGGERRSVVRTSLRASRTDRPCRSTPAAPAAAVMVVTGWLTHRSAALPPPRGLFEYDWQVVRGRLYVFGGEMPNLQIPGKLPESEITPLMIEGEKYLDGKVVTAS